MRARTRCRAALSLVELLVVIGILAILLGMLLAFAWYVLGGFLSGEQLFGELRETTVLIEMLRADLTGLVVDAQAGDLGLSSGLGRIAFRRRWQGTVQAINYTFDPARRVFFRQVQGQKPTTLGGGLIVDGRLTWGTYRRRAGGKLVPTLARTDDSGTLRRVYLTVELSLGPPAPAGPPPGLRRDRLVVKTHLFPIWTNRQLTSVWNR